jgi:hypothetical protein
MLLFGPFGLIGLKVELRDDAKSAKLGIDDHKSSTMGALEAERRAAAEALAVTQAAPGASSGTVAAEGEAGKGASLDGRKAQGDAAASGDLKQRVLLRKLATMPVLVASGIASIDAAVSAAEAKAQDELTAQVIAAVSGHTRAQHCCCLI